MAQQTAVQWLIEQLEGDDSRIARVIGLKKYNKIVKIAKEMEMQQIIDAHSYGYLIGEEDIAKHDADSVSEFYYKETYNK